MPLARSNTATLPLCGSDEPAARAIGFGDGEEEVRGMRVGESKSSGYSSVEASTPSVVGEPLPRYVPTVTLSRER